MRIQMNIQSINLVNLQLKIGSSGQITANIKFNRKEIGENTGEKSKTAETNVLDSISPSLTAQLSNLPNEVISYCFETFPDKFNDIDLQSLARSSRLLSKISDNILGSKITATSSMENLPLSEKIQLIKSIRSIFLLQLKTSKSHEQLMQSSDSLYISLISKVKDSLESLKVNLMQQELNIIDETLRYESFGLKFMSSRDVQLLFSHKKLITSQNFPHLDLDVRNYTENTITNMDFGITID